MDFLSTLFILVIGVAVLCIIVVFIHDKLWAKDAVNRNYPVLGHFRPFAETIGEFYRRYIDFDDREELPFSRAIRHWIYEVFLVQIDHF